MTFRSARETLPWPFDGAEAASIFTDAHARALMATEFWALADLARPNCYGSVVLARLTSGEDDEGEKD